MRAVGYWNRQPWSTSLEVAPKVEHSSDIPDQGSQPADTCRIHLMQATTASEGMNGNARSSAGRVPLAICDAGASEVLQKAKARG
ncbi:hypothetical protein K461DRAFT_6671 [Myriangium duriaei CBS 260.36]|uniref:Uncharacterized protein n=1 Tax=Myriangium duriaei CBS 260.36 TaxID=1168546 RepID=A0A9P4MRT9_9PEZI|nr:hypothetical protein K461DRAFT_6671 [Myriangium duriaei CBS 260.36]